MPYEHPSRNYFLANPCWQWHLLAEERLRFAEAMLARSAALHRAMQVVRFLMD